LVHSAEASDLKLLIGYCYAPKYDGIESEVQGAHGQPKAALLRLVGVADRFRFSECMSYCLRKYADGGMSLEEAVACLGVMDKMDSLPESLEPLLGELDNVLVRELGPVHELWEPTSKGPWYDCLKPMAQVR
jgi:hypothetical protein